MVGEVKANRGGGGFAARDDAVDLGGGARDNSDDLASMDLREVQGRASPTPVARRGRRGRPGCPIARPALLRAAA